MSESGRSSVHGSHLVTTSSEGKRRVPGLKPICDQRKKKSLPKLKVSEKLFQKKIFGDFQPIGGQQNNSQRIELKVDIQSWRRQKDQIEKRMKLEKIDRIKISESFKNDENDTGYFNSGRFQTLFLKKVKFWNFKNFCPSCDSASKTSRLSKI